MMKSRSITITVFTCPIHQAGRLKLPDLFNYEYIETMDFDILFLEQQRILDYIQEGAVGVDPETFLLAQAFIATPIKARSAAISCSCATNMPCFLH